MTLSRTLAALVALAALAGPCAAQDFPLIKGEHPVLITVDDLPLASNRLHPEPAERERITRGLLDVLKKHGIRAVGLVTWRNVDGPGGERLLDLWLQAGHELGNHSHDHLDYTRTDADTYVADVEKGRVALEAFLSARGRKLRFFRFPFLREGDTRDKLLRVRDWLRATGQRNLPVTIDDQDWSFEQPWVEAVRAGDTARQARLSEDFQHALRLETLLHTAAGDALFERTTPQILLLHANAVGAAQWDALFTWMKGRGFRFAGVDEVLADPAFVETHEYVGRYGGTLWDRIRQGRRVARAREQIEQLLQRQSADWSRGDLAAFASGYEDQAVFVSAKGVTRGRQALIERYRETYPDARAMGTLKLEVLDVAEVWGPEVTQLGDATPGAVHGARVLARWSLRREGQPESGGHTLLFLERRGAEWRITHDASL
jgi:peptidoglycan/xylan/chitin deacetylase (PgdA/CDA1 family)/ketosteroid isomerase-like protein